MAAAVATTISLRATRHTSSQAEGKKKRREERERERERRETAR